MNKFKLFLIISAIIAVSIFGYMTVKTFCAEKPVKYADGDCYVDGGIEYEKDGLKVASSTLDVTGVTYIHEDLYIDGGSIEIGDARIDEYSTIWHGDSYNKPALKLEIKDGKPVFIYDDIDEAGQALIDWINKHFKDINTAQLQ